MKKIFIPLLFLTIFISCENSNEGLKKTSKKDHYSELEQQLKNDFSRLENSSNPESIFNNSPELQKAFLKQFNATSFWMQFGYFKETANGRTYSESEVTISETVGNNLEEIGLLIEKSASLEDCLTGLENKFSQILNNENLESTDKDFLLNYIVTFKVTLQHIDANVVTTANGRAQGWWSSWGKCAAGIAGGAITGALTFGLAGAAVGTVALPVVGTVSAGTVGAIGGAIGGALTGAAASCDGKLIANNGDNCSEYSYANGTRFCIDTRPISILPGAGSQPGLRPIKTLVR